MRRSSSNRHGWVNWLAAIAILLQTVVPLVHRPAEAASAGWAPALASFCQAAGSTAPATPDDDKAPLHKLLPCGVCQSLQLLGAGFVPTAGVELQPPAIASGDYATAPAVPCGAGQTTAPQARAPPFSI